jgi:periodic tryptophan protein 1
MACNASLTGSRDDDDDLKEYDLEHYDDEAEEAAGDTMAMFGNVKNLVFHENDEEDPYITMQGGDETDDEEREELQIWPQTTWCWQAG